MSAGSREAPGSNPGQPTFASLFELARQGIRGPEALGQISERAVTPPDELR